VDVRGDVVDRRYTEYRPATRWRRAGRHIGLLRSVRLNVVGWSAFAVSTLAGGGVGYAASLLLDLPTEAGLAGGAGVAVAGVVLVDRRRWARLRNRGSARCRPARR
jgi:hypothetical protein